jgi:heme/copper-type cytochrome/quinol oxidase subunit 3
VVFICLFFSYFYLGHRHPHWPTEPPKFAKALVMLAILISSSVVLHFSDHAAKKEERGRARALLGATVALGIVFLVVQASEYAEHLKKLKPTTDAYGSIFYATTSFHAAHLVLGLLLLVFALALPRIEPRDHTPHRPLHNATLYWHFVDVVWIFIVALLYLLPHLHR